MVIFGSRDGGMFKTAFVTFVCIFVRLFQVFYASASFWFTYVTTDKLALVATAICLVSLQIPVLTNVVIIVMSLAICLLCVLTLLCVISAKVPTIKQMPVSYLERGKFQQLCLMMRIVGLRLYRTTTILKIVLVTTCDILHKSPIDDEDIFLAELSSKPTNDDVVSVANPGILSTNDDSLTKDV